MVEPGSYVTPCHTLAQMYDRILVPTDGSPEVEGAIEHAVDLAIAHDAVIETVYVVDTAAMGSLAVEGGWDGLQGVLSDEGEGAIERVREIAEARGIEVEGTILEGSPARRIVERASEVDADVIVMGTHGRGGIDRLLLGSVAERAVRASRVPVLTVRVSRDDVDAAAIREDVWMAEGEDYDDGPTTTGSDADDLGAAGTPPGDD